MNPNEPVNTEPSTTPTEPTPSSSQGFQITPDVASPTVNPQPAESPVVNDSPVTPPVETVPPAANVVSPQPVKHRKTKKFGFLILIIVLFLAAVAGSGYLAKKALDEKDNQLHAAQEAKQVAESQLSQAQQKISQLDNPQAKANDAKRKTDLASFIGAVKQYKAANPTFPSTEPTIFKETFGNKYLSKLANFSDPNTKKAYEVVPVAKVQTPPGLTLGAIQYQWPGECAGSEFNDAASDTKAAARILLESGETYCQNI